MKPGTLDKCKCYCRSYSNHVPREDCGDVPEQDYRQARQVPKQENFAFMSLMTTPNTDLG